jgi:hypothetical protein
MLVLTRLGPAADDRIESLYFSAIAEKSLAGSEKEA